MGSFTDGITREQKLFYAGFHAPPRKDLKGANKAWKEGHLAARTGLPWEVARDKYLCKKHKSK